jgi:hypothetical protein
VLNSRCARMLTYIISELNVTEADLQEAKVLADGMTLAEVQQVSCATAFDNGCPVVL